MEILLHKLSPPYPEGYSLEMYDKELGEYSAIHLTTEELIKIIKNV